MKKRIKTAKAAEILGIDPETVRTYVHAGILHGRTAAGERGVGRGFYFDEAEVEAFRDGGAAGAQAYRESQQKAAPKRGRKVPAR